MEYDPDMSPSPSLRPTSPAIKQECPLRPSWDIPFNPLVPWDTKPDMDMTSIAQVGFDDLVFQAFDNGVPHAHPIATTQDRNTTQIQRP